MAKRTSIVFLDGIVTLKRTKGGYRIEIVDAGGLKQAESLRNATEALIRDLCPPLLIVSQPVKTERIVGHVA
jgi:hypothetical protein